MQASSFSQSVSVEFIIDNNDVITLIIVASLIESGFRGDSFYCEAKGYPTANFVGWMAMNGSSITDQEWTTFHSGKAEFETTMSASLPLHAVNCTIGGISCVFDNGNGDYRVQSPMMDCPNGKVIHHSGVDFQDFHLSTSFQY